MTSIQSSQPRVSEFIRANVKDHEADIFILAIMYNVATITAIGLAALSFFQTEQEDAALCLKVRLGALVLRVAVCVSLCLHRKDIWELLKKTISVDDRDTLKPQILNGGIFYGLFHRWSVPKINILN